MIAWKSLQLLLLCAPLAAWSNAQAQEAKPNGSQLQPVYSPANPKGGWKVKTQETSTTLVDYPRAALASSWAGRDIVGNGRG
jgi:hypothetical protein